LEGSVVTFFNLNHESAADCKKFRYLNASDC
jgi:hypothetical protein